MAEREPMRTRELITTPSPDPTVLTTAALLREIVNLKELMDTRFEALEKDRTHFRNELAAHRTSLVNDVDLKVNSLRELFDLTVKISGMREFVIEKVADVKAFGGVVDGRFDKVATQIAERDAQTDKRAKADKDALDAALQAAEKAVGKQQEANIAAITKSEVGFNKEIDGMKLIFGAGIKTLEGQANDLKDTVNRNDSRGKGMAEGWAGILAAVIAIAAVVGMAVTVVTFLVHK